MLAVEVFVLTVKVIKNALFDIPYVDPSLIATLPSLSTLNTLSDPLIRSISLDPVAPENVFVLVSTVISRGLNTTELLPHVWNILNGVSLVPATFDVIAVPLLEGLPISRYPPIL